MNLQIQTGFGSLFSSKSVRGRVPCRGFSLVEILMAVFVLGTVVASTLMALRAGFSTIELARDNTMAAQILQSEMENLRMMSWTELDALPEDEGFQVGEDFDPAVAGRYSASRSVSEDAARPGMKEVELEIRWTTAAGTEHTRVYRTLFSKEGLNDYYYVTSR